MTASTLIEAPSPLDSAAVEDDTPKSLRTLQNVTQTFVLFFQSTSIEFGRPLAPTWHSSRSLDDTVLEEGLHQHLVDVARRTGLLTEPQSGLSDAELAVRDRIALLARQYVEGSLSREEDARLAILSEKVRRFFPRVTARDFEVLLDIVQELKDFDQRDRDRRERLGMSTE